MKLWLGLVLFLAGGVVLALWGQSTGAALGTTVGFVSLGLMAWAWLTRGAEDEPS